MRIVALLGVRNEELYMERCLRHLISQGIEVCVIDNESTDRTRQIAESLLGRGVFRIESLHYPGYFDLVAQLRAKEQLSNEINADWFIHHDADEVRQAPLTFDSLYAAINAANSEGYTAVNFDEFVFVPTSSVESYEGTDYVDKMKFYYYFAPRLQHRVNAWKKTGVEIDLRKKAGHQVQFEGRQLSPSSFILRHYIFLSVAHAQRKYGSERVYSRFETEELGWHRPRHAWSRGHLKLPARSALKQLDATGRFDRSDPRPAHLFSAEHAEC